MSDETRWRILAVPGRDGFGEATARLQLSLVAATRDEAIVGLIERSARAAGVVLERDEGRDDG